MSTHPRTYLLSESERADLNSAGNDLTKVQHLVGKLFGSCSSLVLDGNKITGLEARQCTEILTFEAPVELAEGEDWIEKVEAASRTTIQNMLPKAMQARDEAASLIAILEQYPSQILLLVENIRWTSNVIAHIQQSSLPTLLAQITEENRALIVKLREELPKGLKTKTRSLLTHGIHHAWAVERMIGNGVSDEDDFSWRNQMRAYYHARDNRASFMIQNISMDYQYNYLGNGERLVVTQLTERMYATAFLAMDSFKGYAALGPAGTGKTETIKDLASHLGIEAVVQNCSDQLKGQVVIDFFSACSKFGAWGICDEFNRCQLDELEVFANGISSLDGAPWFLTMNPGYAGRTKLPDNIWHQAVKIYTILPDYCQILENMLMQEGFECGRSLASKAFYLFQHMKDSTSQDHYDWGLRAYKAAVTHAGNYLKSQSEITPAKENIALKSSLNQNFDSMLVAADSNELMRILGQVFHNVPLYEDPKEEFKAALEQAMTSMGLKPTPNMIRKAMQLDARMKIRHGTCVLGDPGTGRRSIVEAVAKANEKLSGGNVNRWFIDADDNTNNPDKSPLHEYGHRGMSLAEFFGEFNSEGTWVDGCLTAAFRQCNNEEHNLIVVKGQANAIFMEPMNTVLDDNKMLCLDNGDRLPMGTNTRLIYIFETCVVMSPASVSRLGFVLINPEDVDFK